MSESTETPANASTPDAKAHCGRGHCRSGTRFFLGKLFFLALLIGVPWAVASHVVHGGHCDDTTATVSAPDAASTR